MTGDACRACLESKVIDVREYYRNGVKVVDKLASVRYLRADRLKRPKQYGSEVRKSFHLLFKQRDSRIFSISAIHLNLLYDQFDIEIIKPELRFKRR